MAQNGLHENEHEHEHEHAYIGNKLMDVLVSAYTVCHNQQQIDMIYVNSTSMNANRL